jgi:glycosyltransferase involved in cell wall biosynthesis
MRRLAADPGLRSRLAANGPSVARRFSWEAVARRHLDLYERLALSPAVRLSAR